MPTDALALLTFLTNFLCMAISFWLAIYLLARSQSNALTFRAITALLALAFYFNTAYTEFTNPSLNTEQIRSIAVLIALVATHDLTVYLLPADLRKSRYWLARLIVLISVALVILHFYLPPASDCNPVYHCPVGSISLWLVIDLFKILVFVAILDNLWIITRRDGSFQNRPLLLAMLLGSCTIAYNLLANLLNVNLPRLVSNLLILGALLLLSYSVVRYKTLVSRRTTVYDLPITFLTILCIVAMYLLFAWQIRLTPGRTLVLVILAIFTHASYDIVRESLDRLFRRQERLALHGFRKLYPASNQAIALQRYLKRGLGYLCTTVQASEGFIALKHTENYEIAASWHSLPIGTTLASEIYALYEVSQPRDALADRIAWLVPIFVRDTRLAIIGVGHHKNRTPYSEDELYWLEDAAEEFARVIQNSIEPFPSWERANQDRAQRGESPEYSSENTVGKTFEYSLKLDAGLVHCVEEGLRYLNDVNRLGSSPLVEVLKIDGSDHLERGKQLQGRLLGVMEKLRPPGSLPSEPLPQEWYSYVILHDAYVEGKLSRDIMSRLYISEGTYFRTRRSAIRGVARALMETTGTT